MKGTCQAGQGRLQKYLRFPKPGRKEHQSSIFETETEPETETENSEPEVQEPQGLWFDIFGLGLGLGLENRRLVFLSPGSAINLQTLAL